MDHRAGGLIEWHKVKASRSGSHYRVCTTMIFSSCLTLPTTLGLCQTMKQIFLRSGILKFLSTDLSNVQVMVNF